MMRPPKLEAGTVYLVGAGPGDPGLITWRGLELLRAADVVLYDRLIHPQLLEEASPDAEKIYTGKSPGTPCAERMEHVYRMLSEHTARGASVVRLHGGDPFVFGRGGEETAWLSAHGIPFVIVPGVSSVVAVPGSVGIPLTHRDYASNFAVFSGHAADTGEPNIDWELACRAHTAVFLMAVKTLPVILDHLVRGGRDPKDPAVIIQNGTMEQQARIAGTVEGFLANPVTVQSPAILVVGATVPLGQAHLELELASKAAMSPGS